MTQLEITELFFLGNFFSEKKLWRKIEFHQLTKLYKSDKNGAEIGSNGLLLAADFFTKLLLHLSTFFVEGKNFSTSNHPQSTMESKLDPTGHYWRWTAFIWSFYLFAHHVFNTISYWTDFSLWITSHIKKRSERDREPRATARNKREEKCWIPGNYYLLVWWWCYCRRK